MSPTTITWTPPVQAGVADAGTWNDMLGSGSFVVSFGDAHPGAFIFDASLFPPSMQSTIVGLQFQLEVAHSSGSQVKALEFGYVPDPQPANYSDSLLPWTRGEVNLGTFEVDLSAGPPPYTFTIAQSLLAPLRSTVFARSFWNGRFAVSLRNPASSRYTVNGDTAAAIVTVAASFTGLLDDPDGPGVRAVLDSRFGFGTFSTKLIRDGENPALFVRPWDRDPKDPRVEHRKKPGEGSRDDRTPDV